MKNKLRVGGTILLLAVTSAWGAETASPAPSAQPAQGDLFRANELSVDAFGTASEGEHTIDHISGARVRHETGLGAGFGVNYFATRYLGLGVDTYSESTKRNFFDSISANLTLRIPLGQSGFAPYVFGGGGHQFDLTRVWFGQFGAGIEYRFTPNVGVFTDARWIFPDENKNYGVARLGLRFAF